MFFQKPWNYETYPCSVWLWARVQLLPRSFFEAPLECCPTISLKFLIKTDLFSPCSKLLGTKLLWDTYCWLAFSLGVSGLNVESHFLFSESYGHRQTGTVLSILRSCKNTLLTKFISLMWLMCSKSFMSIAASSFSKDGTPAVNCLISSTIRSSSYSLIRVSFRTILNAFSGWSHLRTWYSFKGILSSASFDLTVWSDETLSQNLIACCKGKLVCFSSSEAGAWPLPGFSSFSNLRPRLRIS